MTRENQRDNNGTESVKHRTQGSLEYHDVSVSQLEIGGVRTVRPLKTGFCYGITSPN